MNDILNKFKQENESLKKNLNEKYEKLSNFERSFCNVRSINVNALSKPLYNIFFKGKKSHMRLFKTKAVQKDKTNVMDKCKNMCLDDVNEPKLKSARFLSNKLSVIVFDFKLCVDVEL